jgi:capsular polysaccharide transport system permease protein
MNDEPEDTSARPVPRTRRQGLDRPKGQGQGRRTDETDETPRPRGKGLALRKRIPTPIERLAQARSALESATAESIPAQPTPPRQNLDPVTPPPSATTAGDAKPDFVAGPIEIPPPSQQRLFSRLTKISFFLLVVAPTLAAIAYFTAFAADRYAVDVKFAIRSPSGAQSGDLIGLVTGGASQGATQSDSYMVVEYLESRQFLDEVSSRLDLQALYSGSKGDALTRLSPLATKEDQVNYLPRVITPYFDSTSQIVSVEVQAFTAEDARRVAEVVLDAASSMVNRVSEQARLDTVRLAEAELARAEAALKEQRGVIARFRDSEQKIDPNRAVAAQEGVLAGLETELADTRAQMSGLREFLSADAPSVRVLQSRIASIERQIAAERGRLGRGAVNGTANTTTQGQESPANLTSAVTRYEELAVDLDFLQRAYLSALASLESARLEADRQQRYVATFVHPALPESARYPRVFLSLALITATLTLIWSILTMSVHVIREHLR